MSTKSTIDKVLGTSSPEPAATASVQGEILTPTADATKIAQAAQQVKPEPSAATDWSIVDGKWERVPISQVVEPQDRTGYDPFALPASTKKGDNAQFDFMHGSTNKIIGEKLRHEGWLPFRGKLGDNAEMRDGVPHVLGFDAPLYYRPKAVAHRYAPKDTMDIINAERAEMRDRLGEMVRTENRKDRSFNTSVDELLSPEARIDIIERMGNGDKFAGAMLASERERMGLDPSGAGRASAEQGRSQFQIPMSDELMASLRDFVRKEMQSSAGQ